MSACGRHCRCVGRIGSLPLRETFWVAVSFKNGYVHEDLRVRQV